VSRLKSLISAFLISVLVIGFSLASISVFVRAQDPSSTFQTEPTSDVQSFSDDFSGDSGAWQYLGSAYRDGTNQCIVLTTSTNSQGGVALFSAPIQGSFTANFRYKAGGGWHGDGGTLFFYKQEYSTLDNGGSLAFSAMDGYTLKAVPGYGIEFDGWQNIAGDFQQIVGCPPNAPGDPSDSHIALIKDCVGNHLAYVNDPRVSDNNWHKVAVSVQGSNISVYVDQGLVLQWSGLLDRTYNRFGFSGATGGGGTDAHFIDDFSITAHGLQKPSLTASCRSSASYSGFNVQINGDLTFNGTSISEAPILLSYSVTGGKTWQDLTLVYTDTDGAYSATWLPSVTGNFMVKATYEGDENNLGTSETVNFAVTGFAEKNILFSVSSNSTVSSLAFNSEHSELSFTVSGPNGTKGYAQVTIAKSLISNAENMKVLLDGKELDHEATSNADSWLLSFNYSHSTHKVSIAMSTTSFLGVEYWTWIVVAISLAVVGASFLVYIKKRRR
jgi:hypothetical protein